METRMKSAHWRKLDNAAKVFPATETKKDTRVFRFYCELNELVEQELLQQALDITLGKYPMFLSVLRRGVFWFYLEKNEFKPIVKEEYKPPCSRLFSQDKLKYLFRVNYYKNRINFEVFHVLTDGTGATQFLKELVKNYLYIKYQDQGLQDVCLTNENITIRDQEMDSFSKYYDESTPKPVKRRKRAHQIRGIKTEFNSLQISEGVLSVQEVLKKAREYQVSMTVYLTGVYLSAIHREMSLRQQRRPVVLMVPVNLRKFFPSESMLNFFGWIDPAFQFGSEDDSFESILKCVKEYFTEELTQERMARRMNEYTRFENHPILRFAPLEVKNLAIQAGMMYTERDITAVFSNMSVVTMPKEYETYIKQFGVFTSTPKVELCMCSFQDKLVLNFTSLYDSLNIQRNFFEILKEHGMSVEMTTNQFPETEGKVKEEAKFFQWVSFIAVVLGVLAVTLNILILPTRLWSLFALGGIFSMWLAVTMGYQKRRNLLKNSMWQLLIISIVSIIWDLITGWRGWSLDYVFPGLTLLIMIFMLTMTKIQQLKTHEYMTYYFMAGCSGLLPIVPMIFGLLNHQLLSVLCMGISVIFLMALLIFRKKDLLTELQKKFHF